MNKKDITLIKKEFNIDTYKLKIKEVFTVYLKKDNNAIIHSEGKYFEMLDIETKELYLENFKKLVSGTLDNKLYELPFKAYEDGNSTQKILFSAVDASNSDAFYESVNLFISKIAENFNYETDIMISFIKASYYRGSSKKIEEYETGEDDTSDHLEFIMGSINKVEIPKKSLMYDSQNQQLRVNSSLDVIVNLKAPIEGFMFPTFDSGFEDVNKVLYYTSKPKDKNLNFIENTLQCNIKLSAEEEKECFNSILSAVTGGKITPSKMQEIYEEIQEIATEIEEGEVITLGAKEIKGILENKNIDIVQEVDKAYEEALVAKEIEFKVDNILPKFNSKSIKIMNQDTKITIAPNNLSNIKQIRDKNGNKCLLIQLTEDVVVDGLKIDVEEEL